MTQSNETLEKIAQAMAEYDDKPRSNFSLPREILMDDTSEAKLYVVLFTYLTRMYAHFPGADKELGSVAYRYAYDQRLSGVPKSYVVLDGVRADPAQYEPRDLGPKLMSLWSAVASGQLLLTFSNVFSEQQGFFGIHFPLDYPTGTNTTINAIVSRELTWRHRTSPGLLAASIGALTEITSAIEATAAGYIDERLGNEAVLDAVPNRIHQMVVLTMADLFEPTGKNVFAGAAFHMLLDENQRRITFADHESE